MIPAEMCLNGNEITDTLVRPGGEWVSGILTEMTPDGPATCLKMWAVDGSRSVVLMDEYVPATGRGPSGGVHVWSHDGMRVYVVTRSVGIVQVNVHDDAAVALKSLSFDSSRSWSTPALDYTGRLLFAIADGKELWGYDLEIDEAYLEHADSDFAVDATAGVSGMCIVWNRPHMAWTQSTVWPEEETSGVSVQQARFNSGGGSFGFIDDSLGVANLQILGDHIVDPNVIIIDQCEHGAPAWGPGQRTWCFNTDGSRVAYTRNEAGYSSLWVFDRATGSRHHIGHGVHGCLSWEDNTLVALRTGARTPQQVVVYSLSNLLEPARTILVQPSNSFWKSRDADTELVEPSVEMADSDDRNVPFRLYKANRPNGALICWIHGGPNDQWQVTFRPQFTYWLSRGYDIAVVDHRGSSGYGRDYLISLNGHWGEYDSEDTVSVIKHLHAVHGYVPEKTVLMGGSAGGLTALNSAASDPSLVAGVVVKYPVVDLVELLRGNDPFESHFMPELIGATIDNDAIARARSPHQRASMMVDIPILIFHGDKDLSVPLVHSERLRDAVNAAGGSVTLEVMEGEGHGFRQSVNILREFALTETFLTSVISDRR